MFSIERMPYYNQISFDNLNTLRQELQEHDCGDSPLCLVGISAGSGLVVRCLGEEGAEAPIAAAGVCVCVCVCVIRRFRCISL